MKKRRGAQDQTVAGRELGRDKVIGDLFKVLKPKCREVILRARARNL